MSAGRPRSQNLGGVVHAGKRSEPATRGGSSARAPPDTSATATRGEVAVLTQEDLPEGWILLEGRARAGMRDEYERELPPEHSLAGIPVEVVAHLGDDILVQHLSSPKTFSVVRLTWTGRQELPAYPWLEFTGTFEEFTRWATRSL